MVLSLAAMILLAGGLLSCQKTEVAFGNDGSSDPNISYYDNYPVDIATYKLDSFITSGHSNFTIGHHADTLFGAVTAATYAELQLPVENVVKDKDVSFDSLVVTLYPNGDYYGDTTLPFHFAVNMVQEKIENENISNTDFYNPRRVAVDPAPIGQLTTFVKPKKGSPVTIRLSDTFGAALLNKFRTNAVDIRTQDDFLKYFRGLCISTDSTLSNTLYYFTDSTASAMRLYYKLAGPVPTQQKLDFPLNSAKQFNNIFYHYTGTKQSVFALNKNQLKSSSLTGNKAYLHSNLASYIKISFPSLLSLKELHPYIKVIKAQLVIKPAPNTYSYPYTLPKQLDLYTTDENNNLVSLMTDLNGAVLTGDLYVDQLYGDNTQYSYDVTAFINNVIADGQFSNQALMLTPLNRLSDGKCERLVVNDQQLKNGIQLKLYVIGL